jgi:hypothetical protein
MPDETAEDPYHEYTALGFSYFVPVSAVIGTRTPNIFPALLHARKNSRISI